ncbi:MAG TPA: tail fiber domain-containing protein [Pyrinomonadaceae bacterium]|nr:tail fiber domain-containing protein [Pyrinomonadaceae bacterium]
MQRLKLLISLSIILFANSTFAQESAATTQAQSAPSLTVSASVADGGVRFAAPGQSLQMRLEIYNAGGELVFDSGARQGSILDWKLADAAQKLTDGSYVSVVTVKDFQGKLRQRLGAISLQSGQISLNKMSAGELSAVQNKALVASRQAQKIDAPETGEVVIMREGKDRAVAVAAHDGQDAQVTSTKGAITFRTGDFFSNRAQEQMRITPDGRVGIGTDKPEAALDVAGTIRARGGIKFDDGTVINSAADLNKRGATTALVGGTDTQTSALAGTGTTNKLPKWLDNTGTLGDSTITNVNGNVGIGTSNPASLLHLAGPNGVNGITLDTPGNQKFRFQTVAGVNNWGAVTINSIYNNGWNLDDQNTNGWFFKLDTRGGNGASSNNGLWLFRIPNGANPHVDETPVFGITNGQAYFAGSVGIGLETPSQKLDVSGNIKITGANNGLIFPDGSKLTSALAGGGAPSGSSIVNSINDPATSGLISEARLSPNVAKLNAQNAWTGQNTFVNGLSANGVAITNVGNPVSATDATNKAYTDANFIKFVPGAEQLSVGDANGTAPMINLRGGSTCCSGPGGHTPAYFKVFQNGSMVATGNLGIGVSPMQGKGYRTSWDSYKGAFRSGYADNEWDDANVGFFSWAGGSNSTAIGLYALAFGDTNSAESTSSIVFGSGNQVKGAAGFSAGAGNRVCDTYGVALGNNAKSGGPLINGKCDPDSFNLRGLAAVAIGYNVTADQDHTTAMGKFASNNGFTGTFVWSDGSATASADTFRNTANNEFAARATGGFRFRTNLGGTTGCNLPAGSGVFNCTSSRTTKENFFNVRGEDVLTSLRKVPVSTWNYISEGQQSRHLGPMAEDFYAAFGLGTSDKAIGVQDLAGVSIAAVKALDERTAQLQLKTAELEKLRSEVNELRTANATLEQRLNALEQSMKANAVEHNAENDKRR